MHKNLTRMVLAVALFSSVAGVAADVGNLFTIENLSAQWEAEDKVEKLRVRLDAERATLAVDEQFYSMAEKLFKKSAMSKEEYLAYRARVETTRATVEEVRAQIEYLLQYSKIFGYRVKIASGGKISDE